MGRANKDWPLSFYCNNSRQQQPMLTASDKPMSQRLPIKTSVTMPCIDDIVPVSTVCVQLHKMYVCVFANVSVRIVCVCL